MSGSWDFSALYGIPAFEDRTISYTVDVDAASVAALTAKKQTLENWLLSCHRGQLIDDAAPAWYYTAECTSVTETDNTIVSQLKIEFSAEPYKKSVQLYSTAYTPSAAADVVASNSGTVPVIPTIVCAAAATVVFGGNSYELAAGTHTDDTFELAVGDNTFNVTSTGAVTISWRAEVI